MRASSLACAAVSATVALLVAAPEARADAVVIKHPRDHAPYKVELEPHLNFGFLRYHDTAFARGDLAGNPEFGLGFRATIEVADPAFIPKLNNSVGVTFGVDFTGCPSYCTDHFRVRTPVGIQWAFHVTHEFSAFADLGGLLRISSAGAFPDFFAMAGGRYLFTDKTAVTLRIGYPFVSLGVSFFP